MDTWVGHVLPSLSLVGHSLCGGHVDGARAFFSLRRVLEVHLSRLCTGKRLICDEPQIASFSVDFTLIGGGPSPFPSSNEIRSRDGPTEG